MKTTGYFRHTRTRADRQWIKDAWIEQVLASPERETVQADGRVRFWASIPVADNRILRVVTLADRETVHNAFFDRGARL